MASSTDAPDGHWLGVLDPPLLRRLVSRRALELGLASRLHYVRAPSRAEGAEGVVSAVLAEGVTDDDAPGGTDAFQVDLRIADGDTTLVGECSRCAQALG